MSDPAQLAALRAPTPEEAADLLAPYAGPGPLIATLHTTLGELECELHEAQAPVQVAHFVGLASARWPWLDPKTGQVQRAQPLYRDLPFHRVVPGQLIQSGDPRRDGTGHPGYLWQSPARQASFDRPGLLSMAHVGPGTEGSQFFITEAALPHLNGSYQVFGECTPLWLIQGIARAPTSRQARHTPLREVTLHKITIARRAPEGKAEQRAAQELEASR